MLIISKQNPHFSDFCVLIQQPLLKGVSESDHVRWFFLIFGPLHVGRAQASVPGPRLISMSPHSLGHRIPSYCFLCHRVQITPNASLQISKCHTCVQ